MDTRLAKGFTTVELLIVLAVIVVFAIIVSPVCDHHDHEKARQCSCTSHVRQIATAVQMYAQDTGRYPGVDGAAWPEKLSQYLGDDRTLYQCPSDSVRTANGISYAMSGLLVLPGGQGINADQMRSPSEVGAICDASLPAGSPPPVYPHGRLIGGGALLDPDTWLAQPDARHGKGFVVGFCDGHAKYIGGPFNERDLGSDVSRAFCGAAVLGLVKNPSANVRDFTPRGIDRTPFTLGGDYCTMPVLLGAAQLWQAKTGAPVTPAGFTGQYAGGKRAANMVRGIGDGHRPQGNAVPIARDAVVVIVARNSNIPRLPARENDSYTLDYPAIRQVFAAGHVKNSVQVYTLDKMSGTRRFFEEMMSAPGAPLKIGAGAVQVDNDLNMVERVAADRYGIGYCSSAFADPQRVTILALRAPDGKTYYYPQEDATRRWVLPKRLHWPLQRTLYAELIGPAWSTGHPTFATEMLAHDAPGTRAMQDGPLFMQGYYRP